MKALAKRVVPEIVRRALTDWLRRLRGRESSGFSSYGYEIIETPERASACPWMAAAWMAASRLLASMTLVDFCLRGPEGGQAAAIAEGFRHA